MTSALADKLENDMRAFILANLPTRDSASAAELQTLRTSDLLIRWVNWCIRFVPVRPRQVLKSPELLANPLATSPEYQPGLDALTQAVTAGEDLTEYLSTRVETAYKPTTTANFAKGRPDLDLMLNDWHIHHLHLSALKTKRAKFVDRTEMLLFAAFTEDVAYFINIYPHGAWNREEIAYIFIDNWPDSPFVQEMPADVDVPQPTEQDRAVLRNIGVTSPFIMRNGKAFMIGSGSLTSAGTSALATRDALRLLKQVRRWAKFVDENPTYVSETLRLNAYAVPDDSDLEFVFMGGDRYGVRERNTGAILPITFNERGGGGVVGNCSGPCRACRTTATIGSRLE